MCRIPSWSRQCATTSAVPYANDAIRFEICFLTAGRSKNMSSGRCIVIGLISFGLAFLVAAELEDPFEFLVAPSTESNSRNSEADMLVKKDGRVMLAWTEFYTSEGSDWGKARISAMHSKDGGRTWKDKFTLQENIGTMNVMEPDLLRLRSGKIAFAFCRKNSEGDCRPMFRHLERRRHDL